MFKFLLHQIWKNKFIRYLLIATLAVIVVSFFLKVKFPIYNFFQKVFEQPEFDNPISYKGKPYGYTPDPSYARQHLKDALENIVSLAANIYDENIDSDEIFSKKIISLENNWRNNLNGKTLNLVYNVFYDLKLYCKEVTSISSASTKWQQEKKLLKRHLKKQEFGEYNPYNFGISKNNLSSIVKDLMDIDYNYLYPAIQKQPDSWAIITLHEQIQQIACKPYRGITWWQRALYFLEYQQEKKVYLYHKKNKAKILADAFPSKVFSLLKTNVRYKEFLKQFFLRNNLASWNGDLKIDQSWSNYLLTHELDYLLEYIKLMQVKSRTSGTAKAKKIYYTLLNKVRHRNIEANPYYLLALAESAFHAKLLNRALANVNHVLKEAVIESRLVKQQAQRIKLIIELSMP